MKTALYFEDKEAQLVLTPESKWEESILKMVHESYPEVTKHGSFYETIGGWLRYSTEEYDKSLMFRMPKNPKE